MLDDPHIRAARLLGEVTYPWLEGTAPLAPMPIELPGTPGTFRHPAPRIGEHTEEMLRSLGYDEAAVTALHGQQVI